ncbi:hypothetical protein CHCC20375_3939 [Bacillus licheniformis]|nr:hypothetical protein CHCC20375_3939 [Bacillus licheniformis]
MTSICLISSILISLALIRGGRLKSKGLMDSLQYLLVISIKAC